MRFPFFCTISFSSFIIFFIFCNYSALAQLPCPNNATSTYCTCRISAQKFVNTTFEVVCANTSIDMAIRSFREIHNVIADITPSTIGVSFENVTGEFPVTLFDTYNVTKFKEICFINAPNTTRLPNMTHAINLERLLLKRIPHLSHDSLRNVIPGESLRFLVLDQTGLVRISPLTFQRLNQIEELTILGHRNLKLDDMALTNLTNLRWLTMAGGLLPLPSNFTNGLRNLHFLDLSRNGFNNSALHLDTLLTNSNLEVLDLHRNRLTVIPNFMFSGVPGVRNLNLSLNQIGTLEKYAFANLTNMEILDLSNNRLTVLPKNVFESTPRLQELHAHHNKIMSVEGDMRVLPNMTRLDLASNQISKLKTNMFAGFDNLQYLRLSNNQIFSFENQSFGRLNRLDTLLLDGNALQVFWSYALMTNRSSLKILDLHDNELKSIDSRIAEDGTFNVNLTDNSFTCACDNLWMVPFVQAGRMDDPACVDYRTGKIRQMSHLTRDICSVRGRQFINETWDSLFFAGTIMFVCLLFVLIGGLCVLGIKESRRYYYIQKVHKTDSTHENVYVKAISSKYMPEKSDSRAHAHSHSHSHARPSKKEDITTSL